MSNQPILYKRCGCEDALGRQLGKSCPKLNQDGHGTWSFLVCAGRDAAGKRIQIRKMGFPTKEVALQAATERVEMFEGFRRAARVAGCVEAVCRKHFKHDGCADCGQLTDCTVMRVHPETLRRSRVHVCASCAINPSVRVSVEQQRLREARTKLDWGLVTDPIQRNSIVPERFHEQYDSSARRIIRAFVDSGFASAAVPDVDAGALNSSAASLGLADEVYAETRAGETVLRLISHR